MVVIHLQHSELNLARVQQRVRERGCTFPLFNELRVLDNSSAEDPFVLDPSLE